MLDFEKMANLDEQTFKDELAKTESLDLIDFLKKCNNNKIRNKYYKMIKLILGKNYLISVKELVNYEMRESIGITQKVNIKNGIIILSFYLLISLTVFLIYPLYGRYKLSKSIE